MRPIIGLVTLLTSSCRHVTGQFFLPEHPFTPPFFFQRSPCPGLNTLANHGYISRNGTDISLRDIAVATEQVFGLKMADTIRISADIMLLAPPAEEQLSGGEIVLDLFDLYTHNTVETDGSLVRQDHFFQNFAQFDEGLFHQLASRALNGTLTANDIAQHRTSRIRDSKRRNPEVSFSHFPTELLSSALATQQFLLMLFGDDPNLETVRTDFLRIFLEENRIPSSFSPPVDRGLPLITFKKPEIAERYSISLAQLNRDLEMPLPGEGTSSTNKTLAISLSVLAVIFLVFLIIMLWIRRSRVAMRNRKSFASKKVERGEEESSENVDELHLERKSISWRNISVFLNNANKGSSGERILSGVSGRAPAGQLTCILGASGSGKTTLLNILVGGHNIPRTKYLTYEGSVCVNGIEISPDSHALSKSHGLAYVAQQDFLMSSATPSEAVRFSARLRLPRQVTDKEIEKLTDEIIADLGLEKVQNRCMHEKQGLSGGEKRRVSLGIELVTRPCILLIDEVTSGLDSHSAYTVVKACHQLAQNKCTTVIMTIHQPSSMIFAEMNYVILMKSGGCMFEGSAGSLAQSFADCGYEVPDGYSVADWILEVSQTESRETLEESGFFGPSTCGDGRPNMRSRRTSSIAVIRKESCLFRDRITLRTEIMVLAARELVTLKRSAKELMIRFGTVGSLSALYAVAFWGVAGSSYEDSGSFSSHVGIIFQLAFSCLFVLMMAVAEAAAERQGFSREFATGHYRLCSYAVVALVKEFVMTVALALLYLSIVFWAIQLQGRFSYWFAVIALHALVSSALGNLLATLPMEASKAYEFVPVGMAPQLLFSGFLVSYETLPVWIRWLTWLQPLTYAFRLLLNEEFSTCLDISFQEQNIVKCATALEAARHAIEKGGLRAVYNDSSSTTLMQAGQYIGAEAIIEYFRFFSEKEDPGSLLWDCKLEGDVLRVNEIKNGYCDITLASIRQARINELFARKSVDSVSTPWFHLVFGRRLRYEYPMDVSSITILTEDLFLPPEFMTYVFASKANAVSMAASSCRTHEAFCPMEYAANAYRDRLDCIEKLHSLSVTTINTHELSVVDGNSSGCRFLHSTLAALRPEVHCPHVSYIPIKDIHNETKCSKSNDYAQEGFFSEDDFFLFEQAARAAGLNATTYYKEMESTDDLRQCVAGELVAPAAVQRILPKNIFCYSYLDAQNATGNNNTTYWVVLLSFWVGLRALSLWRLRSKALS